MVQHLPLWVLVVCGCGYISYAGAGSLSLFGSWDKSYMEKEVKIRIVRKDWKPLGPSSKTDDVLEEYKWSVNSAFRSFLKSSYTFEEYPISNIENIYLSSHYDKDLESIVVIHPVLSGPDSNFVKNTITALALRNLNKQYNIFAVDMQSINNHLLIDVATYAIGVNPRFNKVTHVISPFLVKGIEGHHIRPEQLHLIGWSYSGHLVGYMGRFVSQHYQKKIGSIIALDPFTNRYNHKLMHVSRNDAEVVYVFHTNSNLSGTRRRVGTADFVFNNGNVQPECQLGERKLKYLYPGEMACSHIHVVKRFWYVILFPSMFVGRKCQSWRRFRNCQCQEEPTTQIAFPITHRQAEGVYYLKTSHTKPYGLGPSGGSCRKRYNLKTGKI